jgi:DNA-directed RNA polymerase specialized sigma24 family protein
MGAYVNSLLRVGVAAGRQEALMARLNALPAGDCRCIALRFEFGLDTEAIASALGWETREVQASLNRFIHIVKPAIAGSATAASA